MGKEKAIFKSMLVTKDGNYHNLAPNYQSKNKKKRTTSLFLYRHSFFSYHQRHFSMRSFLKEKLSGVF